MEGMEVERFFWGILVWGIILSISSIGGLTVERAALLNGLVNPCIVSAVMLAVGLLMILDFFLYRWKKREPFVLTLLTLLANGADELCSAIVLAGTGLDTVYAWVRFALGVVLAAVFGWAAWYFCRQKDRLMAVQ